MRVTKYIYERIQKELPDLFIEAEKTKSSSTVFAEFLPGAALADPNGCPWGQYGDREIPPKRKTVVISFHAIAALPFSELEKIDKIARFLKRAGFAVLIPVGGDLQDYDKQLFDREHIDQVGNKTRAEMQRMALGHNVPADEVFFIDDVKKEVDEDYLNHLLERLEQLSENVFENAKKVTRLSKRDLVKMPFVLVKFDDEKIRQVTEAIERTTQPIEIELFACRITAADVRSWLAPAIEKATQPITLNLYENSISAEGAKCLAAAIEKATQPITLGLGSNSIGAEGAKCLAAAIEKATQPIALNLYENSIGDEGVKWLASAIEKATQPITLDLGGNSIGAEGAKCLASAIEKATQPIRLDLRCNSIGDEGAKWLASAIEKATQPIALNLYENSIGDEGAKCLAAAIEKATQPITLDLSRNVISDELVAAVKKAVKRTSSQNQACSFSGFDKKDYIYRVKLMKNPTAEDHRVLQQHSEFMEELHVDTMDEFNSLSGDFKNLIFFECNMISSDFRLEAHRLTFLKLSVSSEFNVNLSFEGLPLLNKLELDCGMKGPGIRRCYPTFSSNHNENLVELCIKGDIDSLAFIKELLPFAKSPRLRLLELEETEVSEPELKQMIKEFPRIRVKVISGERSSYFSPASGVDGDNYSRGDLPLPKYTESSGTRAPAEQPETVALDPEKTRTSSYFSSASEGVDGDNYSGGDLPLPKYTESSGTRAPAEQPESDIVYATAGSKSHLISDFDTKHDPEETFTLQATCKHITKSKKNRFDYVRDGVYHLDSSGLFEKTKPVIFMRYALPEKNEKLNLGDSHDYYEFSEKIHYKRDDVFPLQSLSAHDHLFQLKLNGKILRNDQVEITRDELGFYSVKILDPAGLSGQFSYVMDIPEQKGVWLQVPDALKEIIITIQQFPASGVEALDIDSNATTREKLNAMYDQKKASCRHRVAILLHKLQMLKQGDSSALYEGVEVRAVKRSGVHVDVELSVDGGNTWSVLDLGGFECREQYVSSFLPPVQFSSKKSKETPKPDFHDVMVGVEKGKGQNTLLCLKDSSDIYNCLSYIRQTCQARPIFYVDSPDQLRTSLKRLKLNDERTQCEIVNPPAGLLHDFLIKHQASDPPPIIVINWENFKPSDMVQFNSVIDVVNRKVDNTPIPPNTTIVGLHARSEKMMDLLGDSSFISRHATGGIYDLTANPIPPARQAEITTSATAVSDILKINLRKSPRWQDGELVKLIPPSSISHVEFINPPVNDRAFNNFVADLRAGLPLTFLDQLILIGRKLVNSVIDVVSRKVDNTPIPPNTTMVGLHARSEKMMDLSSFISRHATGGIHDLAANPIPPARQAEITTSVAAVSGILKINLHKSPRWQDIVIGKAFVDGSQLRWQDGELAQLISQPSISHVEFINPPVNDRAFNNFIADLRAGLPLTFLNQVVPIGRMLDVQVADKPEFASGVTVEVAHSNDLLKDALVINSSTFEQCLHGKKITNDELLITEKGLIEAHANGKLKLCLSGNLSDSQWSLLFDYAKKFNVVLDLTLIQNVTLPAGIVVTEKNPSEQVQTKKIPNRFIISDDVEYSVLKLQAELPTSPSLIIVDISEITLDDLFCKTEHRITDSGFAFNNRFSSVWQDLSTGKTVILKGSCSEAMLDYLACAFSPQPYFYIEGQKHLLPGKLIVVSDTSTKTPSWLVVENQQISLADKQSLLGLLQNESVPNKPFIQLSLDLRKTHVLQDDVSQIAAVTIPQSDFLDGLRIEENRVMNHRDDILGTFLLTVTGGETRLTFTGNEGLQLNTEQCRNLNAFLDKKGFGENQPSNRAVLLNVTVAPDDDQEAFSHLNLSLLSCENFEENRLLAVKHVLSYSPFVLLEGAPGVGKSYFMRSLESDPSIKFYREDKIEQWATDVVSEGIQKILFRDEINLRGIDCSQDRDLLNDPPSIFVNGKYYQLTENCKIMYAQNPLDYGGERFEPKLFQDCPDCKVVFEQMSPAFILHRILKPIFETTFNATESETRAIKIIQDHFGSMRSIRDLQTKAIFECAKEQEKRRAENAGEPAAAAPVNKNMVCLGEGNFILTASRFKPYDDVLTLLQARKFKRSLSDAAPDSARFNGVNGLVLQGPPGVGKSEFIESVLKSEGYSEITDETPASDIENGRVYYRLRASVSNEEKLSILHSAFQRGAILIIDEIDSCPLLEDYLNAYLVGEDIQGKRAAKPGFTILSTANGAEMKGRRLLPAPLKSRMLALEFNEYAREDLINILNTKFIPPEDKHSQLKLDLIAFLVDEFLTEQQTNKETPPTFRDLYVFSTDYFENKFGYYAELGLSNKQHEFMLVYRDHPKFSQLIARFESKPLNASGMTLDAMYEALKSTGSKSTFFNRREPETSTKDEGQNPQKKI